MKLHILKINWDYFYDILFKDKSFEIRINDRDFQIGDLIHFVNDNYTDMPKYENNLFQVTYILQNCKNFGLMDGYCIMSIQPVKVMYSSIERLFK